MATGFVQRFKGKIALAQGGLYIGGTQVNATGVDLNALVGQSVQQNILSTTSTGTGTITNTGPTTISSSSGINVYRLARPISGCEKLIQLTTVSSGVLITASTDGSVTINGSSINTTIKSTVAAVIDLVGTSTSNWAIAGLFISTLATLTLSTST